MNVVCTGVARTQLTLVFKFQLTFQKFHIAVRNRSYPTYGSLPRKGVTQCRVAMMKLLSWQDSLTSRWRHPLPGATFTGTFPLGDWPPWWRRRVRLAYDLIMQMDLTKVPQIEAPSCGIRSARIPRYTKHLIVNYAHGLAYFSAWVTG